MAGKLYVVGTPLGNLGDMTPRAVQILCEVDFIAAEDTRVTQKLLHHFEIPTPAVSYHEHNRLSRGDEIVARLLAGESCAVVTDAGMPCISDPGEDLVRLCAVHGVEVLVVPGPSAVIAALAVSGLPTARFRFEGFLSTARKNRIARLRELAEDRSTLIFYEAPHKLRTTLADLLAELGDRRISLCRELTKLHEEVVRTTLSEAVARYGEGKDGDARIRGEFVLVVEGAPEQVVEAPPLEQAIAHAQTLVSEGMRPSDAAKAAAKETGYPKGEIYAGMLRD